MDYRFALASLAASASLAAPGFAQTTYRLIDLTPTGAYGHAVAATPAGAVGNVSSSANGISPSRAARFQAGGPLDLHPAGLLDLATPGRSSIAAADGAVLVGTGAGPATGNRSVPIVWDADGSVRTLPVPVPDGGAFALGVGGGQVVGHVNTAADRRDVTSLTAPHAFVWDVTSGNAVDLHRGFDYSYATGAAAGTQVGYGIKGAESVALLWRGTADSVVNLHPKGLASSAARATDGVVQVGTVGIDVQVYQEKRGRRVRFQFAALWRGTAASFEYLPGAFDQSWTAGIAGDTICGYGIVGSLRGVGGVRHAIAWTGPNHDVTDLNQYLPTGFVSSTAYGVDLQGNVYGAMVNGAGQSHAVVWIRE